MFSKFYIMKALQIAPSHKRCVQRAVFSPCRATKSVRFGKISFLKADSGERLSKRYSALYRKRSSKRTEWIERRTSSGFRRSHKDSGREWRRSSPCTIWTFPLNLFLASCIIETAFRKMEITFHNRTEKRVSSSTNFYGH